MSRFVMGLEFEDHRIESAFTCMPWNEEVIHSSRRQLVLRSSELSVEHRGNAVIVLFITCAFIICC